MKLLVILLWVIMCQAQKTNDRHMRMTLNVLQKDVSDIWTIIRTSGIENLEFGNKTTTDIAIIEGVIEEGKETMSNVKELTTEVTQLILHTRKGFKNEKEYQREAISDLTRSYRDFQTDLIEENTEIKHNVDKLNKQVLSLQETSTDTQHGIETINFNLNERVSEIDALGVSLDSLLKMVENLSVKQNELEKENYELKQTISNMKSDLTMLPLSISCEENWTFFNGHCYQYTDKEQSWDDALATCKSKDSYLVEIYSESELEFLAGLDIWDHGRIWVGATDKEHEGKFVYQESNRAVPTKFWRKDEPNNKHGKEDCVEMDKSQEHKAFNDSPCKNKRSFLCKK